MKITHIDQQLCTKCNLCEQECPLYLFEIGPDRQAHVDPMGSCIKCGHCVAVCPTNAVKYDVKKQDNSIFYEANPFQKIDLKDASQIMGHMLSKRRSIRKYTDQKVDRKDLELILEAMGRSPSAGNRMQRKYYIYQNKEKIEKLEDTISGFFQKLIKMGSSPLALLLQAMGEKSKKLTLKEKYRATKKFMHTFYQKLVNKEYQFLFQAPAVVIITAPENCPSRYKLFVGPDAHNAATHGVLIAESLGLGTCWIGFAEVVLNKKPAEKLKLGIPKGEKVLAAFTVGYPGIKYQRMTPRGPVPVKWFA